MLDERSIELLESGCGLVVGLVAPDGRPVATRGWGLDLAEGCERARVLLGAASFEAVGYGPAGCVGRWVAATGSNVLSLASAQLKGPIAAVDPASPADHERMARYCHAFFDDVAVVDAIPRRLMERLVPTEIVVCTFEVVEAFDQTPGPGAGARLPRIP
jgi:hypothetical protein